MVYYRCKCGKHESWGSMGPPRCAKCEDCGSNMASSPELHTEPKPHLMQPQKVETDQGTAILTRCVWCMATLAEIATDPNKETTTWNQSI